MLQFKRKILKYQKPIKSIFFYGLFLVLLFFVIRNTAKVYRFFRENNISKETVYSLLLNREPPLKTFEGRTNFLVLGISGGNHDGADLTDSMMFVSIDFKNRDTAFVSVPRDLWLPSLKTKINSVYHYGEKVKENGGFILAKSAVSEVLGKPVSNAILLDFSNFVKITDLIGGLDIDVETAFEDKLYPIFGREDDFCGGDPEFSCRYETVKFEKGWQHMNGERALKFVRSRNAEGTEGTDFARSRRQQKIIFAFLEKVKQYINIKDIWKMKPVFSAIMSSVKTDMKLSEMLILGKYFWKNSKDRFRYLVLDIGDKQKGTPGFLVNPPLWQYDGVWVLVPRTQNFDEIHEFIDCQLKDAACPLKP